MTDDLNMILNMTPEALLLAKIAYRTKRFVSRAGEEGIRQSVAYSKCGLGITPEQFDNLVNALSDSGWCSRKRGRNGAWVLTINPAFKDINVPEWKE